jgi:hypothetical protein
MQESWRVRDSDDVEDEGTGPEIQFDSKFHGTVSADGARCSPYDELRKLLGTTEGFQTTKVRRPRKKTPKWAKKDSTLMARILGKPALRRLRVAYLYWRCGWNSREIADDLKTTVKAVESIINRLKHS